MTQALTVLDSDKLKLLRDTICKGASNNEFELFVHACNRTGLDPFMRQIHAVKRWNDKLGREEMTIQTGIDGFRLIAERTGMYAPGRESICAYDKDGKLFSATSFIKKWTKDGTWHEVGETAYWSEYAPAPYKNGKMNPFWLKMPHVMLKKCAEALALRKAFPADFSGLYTKEEMAQAGGMDDDTDTDQKVAEAIVEAKPVEPVKEPVDLSIMPISAIKAKYLRDLIGNNMVIDMTVSKVLASCGFKSLEEITVKEFERFEKGIMDLKKDTEVGGK